MRRLVRIVARLGACSDLVFPAAVVSILGALVVPLPAWLLDAGLALNLAASACLLLTALQAAGALEVSTFPALLLLTTLFRLALNVSSTRLALAEGHAGRIIQAFGEFVVRGDYLVGVVVFAVISLVQWLVVAKGAERVGEVAARFTLDAMPGKQMAIDADLRAGAIDQSEARTRRRLLERESQMFGAMDGAMKFVKGDVLAGLVIVLVNLGCGTAVGVLEHGMELADAAGVYALIAIGDGLVSQVPSLCIATAAGLVVTRVGSDGPRSRPAHDIGAQFLASSQPLVAVAALLAALAVVPGMPRLTFGVLAAGFALAGAWRRRRRAGGGASPADAAPDAPAAGDSLPAEPALATSWPVLGLDLGPAWGAPGPAGTSAEKVRRALGPLRQRLFDELGMLLPAVRLRTSAPGLAGGEYAVLVEEVAAARGRFEPGALYARARAEALALLGTAGPESVSHPASGLPLSRVPPAAVGALAPARVTTAAAEELLVEHLADVVRAHAGRLLGLQEVQAMLEGLEREAPALVRALLDKLPLALVADVLRRLLQERVSIRNLRGVLEALIEPGAEGDGAALAERCRQALAPWFAREHAPSGALYAYLVDPALEQVMREGEGGPLDPVTVGALLAAVGRLTEGGPLVLLTAPDVRRPLRSLVSGAYPAVTVLAYGELEPSLRVFPLGRLGLEPAG
ncbi:MAG TPA: flagellar biosynthesis protein FlhA [Myxococcaceae bacterium]|nr:flagellar biosynthesis protein FlhA [Myxococcaceae bacterium]